MYLSTSTGNFSVLRPSTCSKAKIYTQAYIWARNEGNRTQDKTLHLVHGKFPDKKRILDVYDMIASRQIKSLSRRSTHTICVLRCIAIVFICFVGSMSNFHSPYLRRFNASIDLISIGTVNRQDAHAECLQTTFRRIFLYNEESPGVEKCVVCKSKSFGRHPTNDAWFWKSDGWWCAQKRPLAALVHYFKSTKILPNWLLVVDDDTFINPFSLKLLLRSLPSSELLYMGDTIGTEFIAGGGGWLISNAVMEALKGSYNGRDNSEMPVKSCLAKQQGGSMCWYHSDWAIASCIRTTCNIKPTHSPLFQQYSSSLWFMHRNISTINCPFDGKGCLPCKSTSVTCHKFTWKEQMKAIDALLSESR